MLKNKIFKFIRKFNFFKKLDELDKKKIQNQIRSYVEKLKNVI